jgi:two-component system nitrogen regulation sensor histidine kinase NtrY
MGIPFKGKTVLALAREIAEAHGGRIQLANREGGGLSVILDLPLTPH